MPLLITALQCALAPFPPKDNEYCYGITLPQILFYCLNFFTSADSGLHFESITKHCDDQNACIYVFYFLLWTCVCFYPSNTSCLSTAKLLQYNGCCELLNVCRRNGMLRIGITLLDWKHKENDLNKQCPLPDTLPSPLKPETLATKFTDKAVAFFFGACKLSNHYRCPIRIYSNGRDWHRHISVWWKVCIHHRKLTIICGNWTTLDKTFIWKDIVANIRKTLHFQVLFTVARSPYRNDFHPFYGLPNRFDNKLLCFKIQMSQQCQRISINYRS